MQSLRNIRRRIKSTENTQKLTRAMKMISISKLRVIQAHLDGYRHYFNVLEDILANTAAATDSLSHPFLRRVHREQKILLYVLSSDTGLCGTYNNDLINAVKRFMSARTGAEIVLFPVGKKALDFSMKMGLKISASRVGFNGRYLEANADGMAKDLVNNFLSVGYDGVYCAFTRFLGNAAQKPGVEKILTIDVGAPTKERFLFEPDAESVLNDIVPSYVNAKMRFCLMNAFACEHSARGIAMGEATDNAKELLDNLILTRNKVRQAAITREIIEVISSSEALRG